MAAEKGHGDVCQLLVQHRADVNHQETEVHYDVLLVIEHDIIMHIKLLLNPGWLVSAPLCQCLWSPQHSGAVHQVWGTPGHPNQGTLSMASGRQCYTECGMCSYFSLIPQTKSK